MMDILLRNVLLCLLLLNTTAVMAVTEKSSLPVLTLKAFIEQATNNDLGFETILIDQLPLQYRRDLLLPESDIIMDVKYQYHFYLDQDRNDPETTVSLSKLFPYNGTRLSLSYNKTPSEFTATDNSSLQFLLSQPIAKNAFGKGVQLQDKIIGIENDITRYQIVEAYEDYLASLTAAYYDWYTAYENLKVGKASSAYNQKLMKNILDRQRQKIALPIDVNKMELLLIGKKENVIILQEIYDNYVNLIFKSIRHKGAIPYIPVEPNRPTANVQFDQDYYNFTQNSRTYRTLNLLEQQGTLEVKKAADDLLPSTNLLLGYKLYDQNTGADDEERSYFAGIELRWPFGRSVDKAKKQIAQIKHRKTVLANQDKYEDLRTNLKNLYQQIRREQALIKISKKKIKLAEAILRDESENYSFGKVSLNDYIDAVNLVDKNRFSYTEHSVQLNKILVEWLRLTDQLVNEQQVLSKGNKPGRLQ